MICKCCVLPSQIGSLCDAIFCQAKPAEKSSAESTNVAVTLVAQGTGLTEVRFDAAALQPLMIVLRALRSEVDRLDGTLTVAQCPVAIKDELDVWGTVKDALPLMHRIKQQFDPGQILNPGRFVGGI